MFFSTFRSVENPELVRVVELDWLAAIDKLEGHTHVPPAVITKRDKKERMPCWSPIRLKDGKTRSMNANVDEITALVLDFEPEKDGDTPIDMEAVIELWQDWSCWIYTTTGHKPENPRMRVVVQVSRSMNRTEFKQVWSWAAQRCKSAGITLDQKCKDPRRLWLLPYPNHFDYQSWLTNGAVLDVAMVLSGALSAEGAGAPMGVNTQIDEVVFQAQHGPIDPLTWAKSVKVGDSIKGYCFMCPPERWNSMSAWLRKRATGVFFGCTSANHGHESPYYTWIPDPEASGQGRPAPDKALLGRLDWNVDKEGNKKGLKPSKYNFLTILKYDPRIRDRVAYNEFSKLVMIDEEPVTDESQFDLQAWVERTYNIETSREIFWAALQAAAHETKIHPLLDQLNALEWDGTPRIDKWLLNALHAEDTQLTRQLGRCWLIQAVARAYEPGCKADTVLVLVGGQGKGKSTALRILAGDEWFSDTELHFGMRQVYTQIQKKWIYELSELASVRKSAVESVKNFLVAKEDDFVPVYGHHAVSLKRHCVFCATTNAEEFLIDETGNRRFWPVTVPDDKDVDLEWLREHRDQLLAEAIACYKRGDQWHLKKKEEKELAQVHEQYTEQHPWFTVLRAWLETGGGMGLTAVTAARLLSDALDVPVERQTQPQAVKVGFLMKHLGWTRKQFRIDEVNRDRFYLRPGTSEEEVKQWIRTSWGKDA